MKTARKLMFAALALLALTANPTLAEEPIPDCIFTCPPAR